MKKIISLIMLSILSFEVYSAHSNSNDSECDKFQMRQGLLYIVNITDPYTGHYNCETTERNGVIIIEDRGTRDRGSYIDGLKDGYWTERNSGGSWNSICDNTTKKKEGRYTRGKKLGVWREYGGYKPYLVCEYSYSADGLLDGSFVRWHKNGQKQLAGIFINGKKDGRWKSWHKNGELASNNFLGNDDSQEGEVKMFYSNGQLKFFKKSLKGGGKHVTRFDIDGEKNFEGYEDKNGKLTGVLKKWKNGELIEEKVYKNGKLHGESRYYKHGRLTKIMNHFNGKKHGITLHVSSHLKEKSFHYSATAGVSEFKDNKEYLRISLSVSRKSNRSYYEMDAHQVNGGRLRNAEHIIGQKFKIEEDSLFEDDTSWRPEFVMKRWNALKEALKRR